MSVVTDASGNASFQDALPVGVPTGHVAMLWPRASNQTPRNSVKTGRRCGHSSRGCVRRRITPMSTRRFSVDAPAVLANDLSFDNGVFTAALLKNAVIGSVVLNPDGSSSLTLR